MAKKRADSKAKGQRDTRDNPAITLRCTPDTFARVEQYMEHLRSTNPAGHWTRSSSALDLILKGLDEAGF